MIVVWRVTERCNLACKFCAFDRDLARPRHQANPAHVLAFGAILAEYQRLHHDRVLVSWLGGEPLLWAPLKNLVRHFTTEYGLKVSTTTNGTTLGSPALREHVLECYSELTISIDGLGEVHDRSRGWPGGFAALREWVVALAREKAAAGRGPVLRANVLLMRQTFAGFGELCLELARWGIEEITFNQLGGNDRPEFFAAHRLGADQADELARELPALRQRLADHGGVRLRGGDTYLQRIQATARNEMISVADCHPGTSSLFIDHAGCIAPCSFTCPGYGVPLAEVRSAAALLSLPERYSRARQGRRLPPCEDCHSTQVFEKFAA